MTTEINNLVMVIDTASLDARIAELQGKTRNRIETLEMNALVALRTAAGTFTELIHVDYLKEYVQSQYPQGDMDDILYQNINWDQVKLDYISTMGGIVAFNGVTYYIVR